MSEIGERLASLEAEFTSFRHEILGNNEYIRNKLDAIADSLPRKVDRVFCQARHEKLDDKVGGLEKNGRYKDLLKRIRNLEQKVPAMIQQAALVIITSVLTAVIIRAIP